MKDWGGTDVLGLAARICAAFLEVPTTPLDLRSLVGSDGRLMVSDGRDVIVREVGCVVRKVDRSDIILELAPDSQAPAAGSSVVLEVMGIAALIQCFTNVREIDRGGRVILRTPSSLHMLQRRRFPRVDVYLGVAVYTPDHAINPLPGQMINLSVDGAACVVSEPIPPDTAVRLDLTVLGLTPPEAPARIVRCTPSPNHLWVVGMQFQELGAERQLFIGKYISEYSAK